MNKGTPAASVAGRKFVPVTPGGTPCLWLASPTEDEAWAKLLEDAAHMPYDGVAGFKRRGYTVEQLWESNYERR